MLRKIFLLSLCLLLLAGCQSALMKKLPKAEFKEQLYIDAELNFAIKHPLNWKRLKPPVASPLYRADRVKWKIVNLRQNGNVFGTMLIQSFPSKKDIRLPDRLSQFLAEQPDLKSGQVESFNHPVGPALRLVGHCSEHGYLTIVIQGQQRDFIISLDVPNNRFEELLPTFQDIVASFSEVVSPDSYPPAATK
jgi:hypothetical protein